MVILVHRRVTQGAHIAFAYGARPVPGQPAKVAIVLGFPKFIRQLFQTMAASYANELSPNLVLLTLGNSAVKSCFRE